MKYYNGARGRGARTFFLGFAPRADFAVRSSFSRIESAAREARRGVFLEAR